MEEIRHQPLKINALTDNKSLHDAVNTTKQVLDRHLRVEISALREMYSKHEIELQWIPKDKQLSDVLTKKGASQRSLIQVLQTGTNPEWGPVAAHKSLLCFNCSAVLFIYFLEGDPYVSNLHILSPPRFTNPVNKHGHKVPEILKIK